MAAQLPPPSSTPGAPPIDWWARYAPWRHIAEPGFWIVFMVTQAAFNTVVVWMDIDRAGLNFQRWQPAVWEWSSNLVLLALVPAVIAFERRYPLMLGTIRKNLPWHVLATVPYSLVHVGAMVAIRKAVYATQGMHYGFGGALYTELLYEFIKDFRSWFGVILIVAFYRLVVRRLQGEAKLLDAPDEGAPVESIDRPERFLVKKLGKEYLLPAAEVEWLQAWGNYVNLRVRSRDHPLRSTMGEIESRLDPQRFVRVHRSFIVNLDYIIEIEPQESGDAKAKMKDGTSVPVSRRYRDNLRRIAA
ncbi:MAG: LytTR family transcriptional regulator [Betaproteobacteria bacterium]|nr:LytTR family transcriptional regulator [Betaproteobacteria bacterium]